MLWLIQCAKSKSDYNMYMFKDFSPDKKSLNEVLP